MYIKYFKKMSQFNVLNIIPKNSIARFLDPYIFEITFEILSEIKKEIEWKMLYVISDKSEEDQILGQEKFSPQNQLRIGRNKFEFKGEAPIIEKIPQNDILGASAILLICSYGNNEIFRCGYYLNISFDNEEMDIKIPDIIDANHLIRNLLYEKPRISIPYFEWETNEEKKDIKIDSNEKIMINNSGITSKKNVELKSQEKNINSNSEIKEKYQFNNADEFEGSNNKINKQTSEEPDIEVLENIKFSGTNNNLSLLDIILLPEYEKIPKQNSKYKNYQEFKEEMVKNKDYVLQLYYRDKESINEYIKGYI